MKNISSALVKAQKSFAPALKTSTNPHFKSRYADLSACVEAVIDALNSNGIALIQETSLDDSGVTVETVFIHESGEQIKCGKLHVPASKQDPQGYGSALTYCRRYSIMAACGIAPEDDDGNASSHKPKFEQKPAAKQEGISEAAVTQFLKSISTAKTLDELQHSYAAAYRTAKDCKNEMALNAFAGAKDKRKEELSMETKEAA